MGFRGIDISPFGRAKRRCQAEHLGILLPLDELGKEERGHSSCSKGMVGPPLGEGPQSSYSLHMVFFRRGAESQMRR